MQDTFLTLLYYDLPAISKDGENWIIFSPFNCALTTINRKEIKDLEKYAELKEKGFFGLPAIHGPGEKSDHFQLTLITTPDCNLRCRYCFANAGDNFDLTGVRTVMSQEIAFAAVRYALCKANGRKLLISFFGGEPSLTQSLIKQVVRYARSQGKAFAVPEISFNITTNGVMPKQFLYYLMANDFFLTISMDGIPEVQDLQRPLKRGLPSSSFVERTIKDLVNAECNFMIRQTVTEKSVYSMAQSIEYLHSLGVKQVHFEAINPAGRAVMETKGQPMLRPSAEDFTTNLIKAIDKGGDLDVGVMNSAYMNLLQPSLHFCDGVGGNRVSVTYEGNVTTCLEVQGGCHPTAEYFLVGAYSDTTDEITIDVQKKQTICNQPITSLNDDCHDCFAKYICSGGCPIRNYHVSGDIAVVDPFRCRVINKVLPYVIDLIDQNSNE